ncbi:hypothetical protein Mal15_16850 [Stieleria maiorica]|uniref:Uncharacterized protein n=1 Tax=Stieleria maiorica TaxID=2795974 RepID=A0A5B9MDF7_9BACT|nr:hypothetical protein Mal15_16850 [Stieleria maiorica]
MLSINNKLTNTIGSQKRPSGNFFKHSSSWINPQSNLIEHNSSKTKRSDNRIDPRHNPIAMMRCWTDGKSRRIVKTEYSMRWSKCCQRKTTIR